MSESKTYRAPETPQDLTKDILEILKGEKLLGKNPFAHSVDPSEEFNDIRLDYEHAELVIEFAEDLFKLMDPLFNPGLPYFGLLNEQLNSDPGSYYNKTIKGYWGLIEEAIESDDATQTNALLANFIPQVQKFVSTLIKALEIQPNGNGKERIVDSTRATIAA